MILLRNYKPWKQEKIISKAQFQLTTALVFLVIDAPLEKHRDTQLWKTVSEQLICNYSIHGVRK